MADKLGWGILSTGAIARQFALQLPASRTGRLVAVGSRTLPAAAEFARQFQVPRAYASYAEVLADPEVQAVYLATPHPFHAEWIVRAAEAGKHILCEKPLTLNAAECAAALAAARRCSVFLMEGFMYRCQPQIARLLALLRDGAVGEVRLLRAVFSFHSEQPPAHRLFNPLLGGGSILDVGCYCVSLARLVAGVARGGEIAEPLEVQGAAHLNDAGVDEYAAATLRFEGDLLAQLSCGIRLRQESVAQIHGTEGSLFLPSPWTGQNQGGPASLFFQRRGEKAAREIVVEGAGGIFAREADLVAENLKRGEAPFPAPTWADTAGNLRVLDRWRAAVGLRYPAER